MVREEVWQRLVAGGAKLERYDNRTKHYLNQAIIDCSKNWKEHKEKV